MASNTIIGAARVDILRRGDPVQQIKEDTSDPTCVYVGLTPRMDTAVDDSKWQVRRVENKDGVVTTLFANDAKYNVRWDQRTMLFPACEGNQPIAGVVETNLVSTPAVHWLDLTVSAQEESYSLPSGTKRFLITNDGTRRIQVAYTAGDTAIAGSWYPIDPSASHFEEEIGADQTIYAQVSNAVGGPQRLIILSWS